MFVVDAGARRPHRLRFAAGRGDAIARLVVYLVRFLRTEQRMAVVENPSNNVGAGYLLSAYLLKLREVGADLPAARQLVPVSRDEEPHARK